VIKFLFKFFSKVNGKSGSMKLIKSILVVTLAINAIQCRQPSDGVSVRIIPVAPGWAWNSVNAVIFRRNSVVSSDSLQYAAFYNDSGTVVLVRRKPGTPDWEIHQTCYQGNVLDAHNSISIMIDGAGYLHMAWNHHDSPLLYCRSRSPESLELTEPLPMTGLKEDRVSYPEFYRLPDGDLVFLYRDGASGRGNIMMNLYDTETQTWTQVQDGWISGQDERNAYWQAAVDNRGTIQLSWVWRETWDVATNHDLCYAKSPDRGKTWQKSTNEAYQLPITAQTAEIAWEVPQNSELINQTSMCADDQGFPWIATYWRPAGSNSPQYHVVYHNGSQWKVSQVTHRQTPFSLSGGGTKRIPLSRPQIMNGHGLTCILFRDAERNNRVSAAICEDPGNPAWLILDLTEDSVGQWEPTYDTELWMRDHVVNLFVLKVGQGDAETVEDIGPQMVSILEWKP
jgi:hypothetical protein